jgi:isocitrate dehydrogenase (NAD+)
MPQRYRIGFIEGEGIGPEVSAAARQVVEATGLEVRWVPLEAGAEVAEREGTPMPLRTVAAIRELGVALKGPLTTPIGAGYESPNAALRKALDLYACVRPCRNWPAVRSRYSGVDLVVVRENTEGIYSGIEHEVVPGVVESLRIITERASRRIARFAFELARQGGRSRVHAVHKANILKRADGLFLRCCREIAAEFPEMEYLEIIIDACAMQLVTDPARFQVLVMENFHGDILSDLCAGLVGGLGVVPGANLGGACGVFEAVHGSAPDIAGRNLANPMALILSAAEMLDFLQLKLEAARIRDALERVLRRGQVRTRDLGGVSGTDAFAAAVAAAVQEHNHG